MAKVRKKRYSRIAKCICVWGLICFGVYIYCETEHNVATEIEQLRTTVSSSAIEQELAELLENNKEAKEFIKNYPNRTQYMKEKIELSEDFEVGKVPLFMQWDMRWGYEDYGESIIGLSGCGPTCLSMAYVYFTEDLTGHPAEMADFCEKKGYYTSSGTSWELWTDGVKELGLSGKELALDEQVIKNALDEGSLIVCSMRPGDFTNSGHYILLWGYHQEGFQVHDPNRKSNSEKTWKYDELHRQIKNLWAITRNHQT